jgi:hypothetical protein
MPTFPPLIPASRSRTPGSRPSTPGASLGGRRSVTGHSNAPAGGQLQLAFQGLTEEERFSLESHYHGQKGDVIPFALDDESPQLWRYISPPEIEDFGSTPPHFDATVTLEPA